MTTGVIGDCIRKQNRKELSDMNRIYYRTVRAQTPEEGFRKLLREDRLEYGSYRFAPSLAAKKSFVYLGAVPDDTSAREEAKSFLLESRATFWSPGYCFMVGHASDHASVQCQVRINQKADMSDEGYIDHYVMYCHRNGEIGYRLDLQAAIEAAVEYVEQQAEPLGVKIYREKRATEPQVLAVVEQSEESSFPVNEYMFFGINPKAPVMDSE